MLTKRALTFPLKENKEDLAELGREFQRLETEGTKELREEVRQKGIANIVWMEVTRRMRGWRRIDKHN